MGVLTGTIRGRKRKSLNGRARTETYRLVCYLDRLPPHILEDEGYQTRHSTRPEVECEIEAEDFGAAVAEAIRSLEDDFTHVHAVERLSL